MHKNLIKTFILCVMFLSIFFINIGNTKAVTDGDNSGYAKCYYKLAETSVVSNETQSTTYYTNYYFGIAYYKINNENTGYRSWASIGCNLSLTGDSVSETGHCSFTNYYDIFYNAHNYISYFNSGNNTNPKWKCPSKIWIDKPLRPTSTMSVFFSENECRKSHWFATCQPADIFYFQLSQSGQPDDDLDYIYGKDAGFASSDDPFVDAQINKHLNKSADLGLIMAWGNAGDSVIDNTTASCKELLGEVESRESLAYFLNNLFWIIAIIGIILLMVLTMIEFVKVLTGQDDEGLRKAFKHTIIRIVCAVILLLLPTLINTVVDVINNNYYKQKGVTMDENRNYVCEVEE